MGKTKQGMFTEKPIDMKERKEETYREGGVVCVLAVHLSFTRGLLSNSGKLNLVIKSLATREPVYRLFFLLV